MKEHKNKLSKKDIVENVTRRYYLIISILTYIVFLFPKLFGAKFFTAIDMFVFIFKTGKLNLLFLNQERLSIVLPPWTLLIFFCIILILNTILIIGILKHDKKKEIRWPHWVYLANIFLILLFGLFMMNYFTVLEGELQNDILSGWMGYSFWAYQILGYGFAISLVILTIWSYIFVGKEEFRKQAEREGLGRLVPKDFKSNTNDYIIYLVVFLIVMALPVSTSGGVIPSAINGAIRIIIALLVASLIIWILKRKRKDKRRHL